MIDTKRFTLLENVGYPSRPATYEQIRICYGGISGVTTYFDNGEWYIVKSNSLQ